ncbi:uncharacterized protein si:dkeyp-117h8.4 isoform X2 [Hippocampus zosterae]|uniref:uncharacterized protein si:dkeyp-117h8.4 isoform X2 n=1 Tax=Hippocampus zosterae TaxID=109293 RepID=UPI00223DE3CA|nr:uncharacterized protein si:dkeyp-117h8.4 isoform X2 [Hippocampus zosterae]
MDEKLKHQLATNGLKYKLSLRRIIQKYSNLPYQDMAIEVDLDNTSTKDLMHYMTLSKKQIKAMESESLLDSRGDLLQLHNSSSTLPLDQTQQDGGHDDAVSCQMSSDDDDDDDVSNVHSRQSSLNGRQSDFPETDVLPEDQDEELELSLRSQGSTLSELYPSMIDRIGRAQHRWHISKMANGVLRKYCKWRRQSGRGSHINSVVTSNRQTTRKKKIKNPGSAFTNQQYSSLREQSVLGMDPSAFPESPKLKRVELNDTFTVGEQPSTPRRFSVSATGRRPSVCALSPSLFSQSSEASLDMLLRSRRLMGEEPSPCFLSPSQSFGASSGVSLDPPLGSRRFFFPVAKDQQSSGMPSPPRSSDHSTGLSIDLSPDSERLSCAAAKEQPSLWLLSPSRSSDPTSDQSLRSKGLSRAAAGEQPSLSVLSPSKSSSPSPDQSLRSKRLFNAATREQPSLWLFSPSRSSDPTLDQSLRSKRLCSAAAGEQPSLSILSPSKSTSPSQSSSSSPDQSLRLKRLFTSAAVEQPVSWVLSPSRSSGPNSGQSPRSKRLCSAATGEVPSSLFLSPSKSSSPSSGQTLRAKRLFNAATREQPSSWVLSPSRPSGPSSDLSLRSKRFALASAQEQHQTAPWVLSPSRSVGLSLDLSLRSKRLAMSAADEQQQLCSEVPSSLQSSGPSSDLSHRSKSLFFSAGVAAESTEFKERPDINGSPVRRSPLKVGMVNWEGLRRSDQSFSRSPNSAHVLGHSRPSASPLRKLLRTQALHPKSSLGSPQRTRNNLCRHFSFDSSLTTECATYSKKDLDDDYKKHYHKFVCQSKPSNGLPSRCHSSQTLVALALSPHRFELRKRHRELDRENLSHSKRWSPYSPGSKRHTKEMLRRCLCLPDAEVSRCGDFKQSEFRGYRGRPSLQDSIRARGLPEECFLGKYP